MNLLILFFSGKDENVVVRIHSDYYESYLSTPTNTLLIIYKHYQAQSG
jgi:hypothetical protein